MAQQPLTIKIMTATLSPGDAIGNYILSKRRIFQGWGARVELYADHIDVAYERIARPSFMYHATGSDILWYHYSIYAENITLVHRSGDFKIMDYHGVTPPHLFPHQNDHLAELCRQAIAMLPKLRDSFDEYVVHSDYMRQELAAVGVDPAHLHKIALCVDGGRFDQAADPELSDLLGRLDYLLFVGRLVGQKDILSLLEIFARVRARRPDTALILVGSRDLVPAYQEQIDARVAALGLADSVLFTGQVNNPAVLATLYRHARFTVITSEWESFCVPVIESAFFGTPPAVSDVPPLPEVAGPAGLLFDKSDLDGTAQKILEALDDEDRYDELTTAALAWSQEYTDEALERNLEQLLRHIAADLSVRG